jgi:tetraacyldisaccharide 4'-kinase
LPVFRGRVSAVGGGRELRGKRVVAFAGIGRPEKFFALLRRMKADVLETAPFPDHYSFSAAILSRLEARARALGAILVTTEKDAARLPAPFLRKVAVLPVTLGFAEPEQIDDLLAPIVALAHERRHRQLSRANTPRF